MSAIRQQTSKGTAFGAANEIEIELAEELCRRVPSIERIRFTNSGTEATMFAMRVAKAFSGRPKFARIEGGYHGTHEYAQVSGHPEVEAAGSFREPRSVADSRGISSSVLDETVVIPYNDIQVAEHVLSRSAE
jgi:glutamate-1-semialdehyde 2,1-aminomutase